MADTHLSGPVRVRFAPSPTGHLHVGGARTAIYNELLRRSLGGALILRIEDTDRERSDTAMTRGIVSGLEWLGLAFDEGPVLQSERLERHRERAEELLAAGRAYRCFCTSDELEPLRRRAEAEGRTFRYPRTCLERPAAEVEEMVAAGTPWVLRLRMPDEPVRFTDMVRGAMAFAAEVLDDFILLRSDGSPTYHLSVVVDDADMGVTHVLRGEDHLSNTPKHVALFAALGAPVPVFGHLPLILGPDKKRLSKRTGATSVEEFRAQGILPQALYNYLALLGWSPGDDAEILSHEEMVARFTVERLNASAAVFDRDKLAWMNARYLSALPLDELWPHLEPFLEEEGLVGTHAAEAERGRLRPGGGAAPGPRHRPARPRRPGGALLPGAPRIRRGRLRPVPRRSRASRAPRGPARPLHPGGAVRGRAARGVPARPRRAARGQGGLPDPSPAHGAVGHERRAAGLRPGGGDRPRGHPPSPHPLRRLAARGAGAGGRRPRIGAPRAAPAGRAPGVRAGTGSGGMSRRDGRLP